MAANRCNDCNEILSDNVLSCPSCGNVRKKEGDERLKSHIASDKSIVDIIKDNIWLGLFIGVCSFLFGMEVTYIYFGFIEPTLDLEFDIIWLFQGFPSWIESNWKFFLYLFVSSHQPFWARHLPIPAAKAIAITTPVSAGFLFAWAKQIVELKKALLVGLFVAIGYFPAAIMGTAMVNGIVYQNARYTFSPMSFIIIGVLYPVVFGSAGSILYLSVQGYRRIALRWVHKREN